MIRLIGLLALLTAGCASIIHTPIDGCRGLPKQFISKKALLEIPDLKFEEAEMEDLSDKYYRKTVRVVGRNSTAEYRLSKLPGKKKLVIVVPIYGSSHVPSDTVANRLTIWNPAADTNVLLIQDFEDMLDWSSLELASTREVLLQEEERWVIKIQNLADEITQLVDWAEKQREIDISRIGIAGFSVGSITGLLAMEMDDRISVGAFGMGGADLHDTFAYGKASFMTRDKKEPEN